MTASGVTLAAGAGFWASVSDRRKKENFRPIDAEALLRKLAALPVTESKYKSQPATQRHIGPMAQDFYAAFKLHGIGADTIINTIDIDGVNMVAIQALEARTAMLKAENEALKARVAALEAQTVEAQGLSATLIKRMEALERNVDAASSSANSIQTASTK
ncbi:MAG: hypothetical protein EOP52_13010 [Sphingobacteriales bacterium]|nr:MAG: hypothetical protein EOP52_13010 [Sphingobacteriales bacterium]